MRVTVYVTAEKYEFEIDALDRGARSRKPSSERKKAREYRSPATAVIWRSWTTRNR